MVLSLLLSCFKEPVLEPSIPRNAISVEVEQKQPSDVPESVSLHQEPSAVFAPPLPTAIFRRVQATPSSSDWQDQLSDVERVNISLSTLSAPSPSEDVIAHWERQMIHLLVRTTCRSEEVTWTFLSASSAVIESGVLNSSPNGTIQWSTDINTTRQFLKLQLHCSTGSREYTLQRSASNNIRMYGENVWKTEAQNAILLTGAEGAQITVWGRPIGRRVWQDKYRIGVGQELEWIQMFQANLTKPIEPLSFLIDDAFQQPYDVLLQVTSEESTQVFEVLLLSSDTVIGIQSPHFSAINDELSVQLLVDALVDEATLPEKATVTVSTATEHLLLPVPLSSGEGETTVALKSGGIVHLVASVGNNRSETYVFVDGDSLNKQPTAVSFPSATYIDGLSREAHIDNNVTSGLLYQHSVDTISINTKKGQQSITPIQLTDKSFSLPASLPPVSSFQSEAIIHHPSFVRLGDHLLVEKLTWDVNQLHQQRIKTVANSLLPLRVESRKIPVLLSHSDAIALHSQQDKLHNSSKRVALSFPASTSPYYITTEPHYSDDLLLSLLEETHRPHDVVQDAVFLQKAALVWDSIATRKAPWLNQILTRAKENVEFLIAQQHQDGHWGNPTQDWLIVHALLLAGEQGLISSSRTIQKASSYICAQPISPAVLHIQHLYRHSIWNTFSCGLTTESDVHPIWRALWGEETFVLEADTELSPLQLGAVLQYYAQHKPYASVLTSFMDRAVQMTDPWVQISWWILHKSRQEKYTNLRLYEYDDGRGIASGLFHTWQRQNLFSVIDSPEASSRDLLIKGSGTLNWSVWHFSPQRRASIQHSTCSVDRWLANDRGIPIDEEDIRQGETIYIVHAAKGKPHQTATLLIFPAAGLSHQRQGDRQEATLTLDEDGSVLQMDRVIAQFQGSFQFPASLLYCGEEQARSQDDQITIGSP